MLTPPYTQDPITTGHRNDTGAQYQNPAADLIDIPLYHIPNFELMQINGLIVNILFPEMYRRYIVVQKKSNQLSLSISPDFLRTPTQPLGNLHGASHFSVRSDNVNLDYKQECENSHELKKIHCFFTKTDCTGSPSAYSHCVPGRE